MFLWSCKVLKVNSYKEVHAMKSNLAMVLNLGRLVKCLSWLLFRGHYASAPCVNAIGQEVQVAGCQHHCGWCRGWWRWSSTSCLPSRPFLPCPPCRPCHRACLLLHPRPSQGSRWWRTARKKWVSFVSWENCPTSAVHRREATPAASVSAVLTT